MGGEELPRDLLSAAEYPPHRSEMTSKSLVEGFHRKSETHGEQDHTERNDPIARAHPIERANDVSESAIDSPPSILSDTKRQTICPCPISFALLQRECRPISRDETDKGFF